MKYLKIFLILLLLCGCSSEKESEEEIEPTDPIGTYFSKLPEKPSDGDGIFVSANDGLHYEEVWDEFYEKVENEEECDVTIARYTIEGDVIYELLKHEDGFFTLYTDNSRDQFSSVHEIMEEKREYLYDLSWLSNEEIDGTVKPFAEVSSPVTGITMKCSTNLPGFQLYTGNFLKNSSGKENTAYKPRDGFCLETQFYPNSVNQDGFPDCIFGPEREYDYITVYQFS